jgi:hypothetical protein
MAMITFHLSTEVKEDHRVELTLPPEVPTGRADLVVSVSPSVGNGNKQPRSSLADWADQQAEHRGDRLNSADVAGFTGRRF